MNQSGFLAAFLTLLLFTQGYSYPNNKIPDYTEDNPDFGDDDAVADADANFPKEENTKPIRLLSKDSTLEVSPGEKIILPCETVNGDEPVISWKRSVNNNEDFLFFGSSVMLTTDSDKRRISKTNNNSLVIINANLQDAGTYTCEITATEPKSVKYTVRVSNEAQTLRIWPGKSVTINEKDELKLSCSTVGEELPISLIWSHGSNKLHSTVRQNAAEVHIKSANRHNAGYYQCLADFGPGKDPLHNVIDVTVRYAPEVDVMSDYVHSGVGQIANLTCIVHAYPVPNITWHKKEGDITKPVFSSNHVDIRDGKHIHNLTIRGIQKHDFGKYLCKSANSLGSHQKEIELTGTPNRARFIEQNLKDDDKTLVLKWEVESYSPVTAYELRYRKNNVDDWTIEKPKVASANGDHKYIAEHAIHNLLPDTYHFELRSQNKFGWSEYSITKFIEGPMPLMSNDVGSDYKLQRAEIGGGGGASSSQPVMFVLSLLLVVSLSFSKIL